MKKILAGIVTIVLVMSFGMTTFAAETITEKNDSKNISVQAKAVYVSPDDMYETLVVNGKASVTLSNNKVINISTDSTALDGRTLNVIDMIENDKEAYEWINGMMNGLCDKFTTYDIYFSDNNGNRVDVTGEVTVSITTPDEYTNVQVYHIGLSAKPEEITSKQSDGNTVFSATGFSYYVLANKTTGISLTKVIRNIVLWIALLFVSGGVIITLCVMKKRKKAGTK